MKVSENKTKSVLIRFTDEDYRLLQFVAKGIGQSVSSLIRMYVATATTPVKVKLRKGELKNEDIEAVLND